MSSIDHNSTFNIYVDVNVGAKDHSFNSPLILDKYDIIIIMQKKKK